MRSATILLPATLLLSSTILAYTYDCANIQVDKKNYNFKKLGGPHTIQLSDSAHPRAIHNTTYTIDFCQPLQKDSNVPSEDSCAVGTQVCGIKDVWNSETDPDKKNVIVEEVKSIAGHIIETGSTVDPKFTRINSTKNELGGICAELGGGKYDERKQKAIINFLCDKERTGNEVSKEEGSSNKRDDDDGGDASDKESSLTFISYGPVGDFDVLEVNWRTKYACEDYNPDEDPDEDGDDSSKKGGWGVFTWFIVLLFLGISAYLIFGSWLNYNRYGARGWDLLPHGDTIRDVPYIFKDFSRKVLDTFSGGGSRGGYSAV